MNLFSSRKDLAERISALLSIPVVQGDGLPVHACRSCVRQVLAIETKLANLRDTAKCSYDKLCDTVGSRKRPKNTSSVTGVSPHTARTRPLAKRLSSSKQLFPENSESLACTPTSEIDSCQDKAGL